MKYHTIIIGAGSAGCVLAGRLSEDPQRSVLLLEAGPDYATAADLPPEISSGAMIAYTHDWGYTNTAQGAAASIPLWRGKLVGGCSATNAAIALRGAPSDYEAWAALGNAGWAYADVLPVFKQLENDADFADEAHGQAGPVPIQREPLAALRPEQKAFLDAAAALGYKIVADYNASDALGAGVWPKNVVEGVRQSAALTHLAPARGRANLTIKSGVLVDRIEFNGKRAVGVRLHGTGEVIEADQIILAAGAFGSPAILLRSGVGSAADLAALGIPVVHNLPGVGQNLTDHPVVPVPFMAPAPEVMNASPIQVALTLQSPEAKAGPDVQIFVFGILPPSPQAPPLLMLCPALMQPRSRGQVRLKSNDATEAPHIDLGFFTDPADMQCMKHALQVAWQLAATAPLQAYALQPLNPHIMLTNEAAALEPAICASANTYSHAAGTCRMGPATDPQAVVNAQGWVYGVEGLAVVDASILPTLPSANPNLPILMVAERCATWLAK